MKLLGKISEDKFIVEISDFEIAECCGFSASYCEQVKNFMKQTGNTLNVTGHYSEALSILNAYEEISVKADKCFKAIETLKIAAGDMVKKK